MNRLVNLLGGGLLSLATVGVAAPHAAALPNLPFIPGQIVVQADGAALSGEELIRVLPRAGLAVIAVEPGQELAALARQRALGRRAMLNLQATAFAEVNDPYRALQWHLDVIEAAPAWDLANGAGVLVAVLDTGLVRSGASDGIGCVEAGRDIVNDDDDPSDGNGHGTHVSGTLAQATDNGVGVAGVAYGACILPVKVLSDQGSGGFAGIAEGIYWAVDRGAQVINMSLGVSARYGITNDPVLDPALDYAYGRGVTVVAAAGNDSYRRNVSYPAIYPTTIAVGATDARNQLAPYSNRGTGLDLVAPGGDNSRDDNGDGYADGVLQESRYNGSWNYYFFQGTSMATPHVAAAAALLLQHEALSPDQVRDRLGATALDLGSTGYDSSYGNGLIQLLSALSAGAVSGNANPVASFQASCDALLCQFDGSASYDPDSSDTLTYAWDFGDGTIDNISGASASHEFTAAASYVVTLKVSDGQNGMGSAQQSLSVTSAAAGCTDADGDGVCSIASGGTDCDDSDPNVYPGHNDTRGRWGRDGVDNDCDGVPDA